MKPIRPTTTHLISRWDCGACIGDAILRALGSNLLSLRPDVMRVIGWISPKRPLPTDARKFALADLRTHAPSSWPDAQACVEVSLTSETATMGRSCARLTLALIRRFGHGREDRA
jgi:hypothetical protein